MFPIFKKDPTLPEMIRNNRRVVMNEVLMSIADEELEPWDERFTTAVSNYQMLAEIDLQDSPATIDPNFMISALINVGEHVYMATKFLDGHVFPSFIMNLLSERRREVRIPKKKEVRITKRKEEKTPKKK